MNLNQSIIAPTGYRILIGMTNLTIPNTMYNVAGDETFTTQDTDGSNEIEYIIPFFDRRQPQIRGGKPIPNSSTLAPALLAIMK